MPNKQSSDIPFSPLPTSIDDSGSVGPSPMFSLASLVKGDQVCIRAIASPVTEEQVSLRERLEELGFLPGEIVRVVATAFPSGDPIAVRIGNTTFALRRHEAEMIFVDSCR